MPGINTSQTARINGIDADDMDLIRQFLQTPAWQRTPDMLCPKELADQPQ